MKYTIFAPIVLVLALALPAMAIAGHNLPDQNVAITTALYEDTCKIHLNLAIGSRGEMVSCLQERLIKNGLLSISMPTGYFGEMTKIAVTKWQEKEGLPTTGFFGPQSRMAFAGHDDKKEKHAHALEAHPAFDVSPWPTNPSVSITIHPDTKSGYNLEISVQNFRFAPEHAGGQVLPNEGHAHLIIDGKKLARVYGNWFHIPADAVHGAGKHEIVLTLNANDHSDLSRNGVRIEARSIITK